jgi:cytochrome c-type biogenesis protein CcmE
MSPTQRTRLKVVLIILVGVAIAAALTLYALRQKVSLFYTPTQVLEGEAPSSRTIRVGGIVVHGSVKRVPDSLDMTFTLSDTANDIVVHYSGILPDLFKEGQGVVVQGRVNRANEIIAREVLAKHDENYMPPEVIESVNRAKFSKLYQKSEK